MSQYLIRLTKSSEPCWVADWEGDPGRTLVKENAKRYLNEIVAARALRRLRSLYPFREMEIEPLAKVGEVK